jgi:hypothetical protein
MVFGCLPAVSHAVTYHTPPIKMSVAIGMLWFIRQCPDLQFVIVVPEKDKHLFKCLLLLARMLNVVIHSPMQMSSTLSFHRDIHWHCCRWKRQTSALTTNECLLLLASNVCCYWLACCDLYANAMSSTLSIQETSNDIYVHDKE